MAPTRPAVRAPARREGDTAAMARSDVSAITGHDDGHRGAGAAARLTGMPDRVAARVRSWLDWVFRNRQTGRITVGQLPNLALWIFLGAVALRAFVPSDTGARDAVDGIGAAALAWWAADELLRGVNPWRRLLGGAGLAFTAARVASLLG